MKKILGYLLNVATFIALALTILGGLYLTLPEEVKSKIPIALNQVMLLIFANGGLGTFMVATKFLINKSNDTQDLKIEKLAKMVLDITNEIKKDRENNAVRNMETVELLKKVDEKIALDLEIKKKNPVLPKELKDKIEKLGE